MTAVHAKRALWTALAGVPGVTSADVAIGEATLDCVGRVDEQTLRDAVAALGFTLTQVTRELPLA